MQLETARSLAQHALSDFAVVRKLAPDPDVGSGVVMLHVQQVVEKALTAMLTLRGVEFPSTQAWTIELNYDGASLTKLDRDRAIKVAEVAISWCLELM